MKLIAALAIVATSTFCGYALAGAVVRRARLLAELLHAIRKLRVQVVHLLEPMDSALRQSGTVLLERIAQQLSTSTDVYTAWQQVVSDGRCRGGFADSLGNEEVQALDRMFAQLGISGREAQDEALKSCAEMLEDLCKQAQERSAHVSKLYTSMGLLAGLAITILML